MSVRSPLVAMILVAACIACGGGPIRGKGKDRNVGSASGGSGYSVSAAENYETGMRKLGSEDWLDAARFFNFVKARFPYSKYAVLAELRIADAEFGAGAYLESADAYRMFIKFHPSHEMVENGYAPFRVGECYFHMLPDDWFMLPPSYEKDLTSTQDAARELDTFIQRFPRSEYAPKAKDLYHKVAHLLASHEWYVAGFYWDRNLPMGTVLRLRTLLKKYPDLGYEEDALWLIGRAYERVNRNDDAKKSFQTLIDKYPKSIHAGDAKGEIDRLARTPAPAKGG